MKKSGFSLIEILVVLLVFSIIGIIVTSSVLATLRSARKSDSESKVRANIDYAMAIISRHIRNARTVSCPDSHTVTFEDQREQTASFFLQTLGQDRYVASSSATQRLTSSDINITDLTFACNPASGNNPPSVDVTISAIDKNFQGSEAAKISTSATIVLRTNF